MIISTGGVLPAPDGPPVRHVSHYGDAPSPAVCQVFLPTYYFTFDFNFHFDFHFTLLAGEQRVPRDLVVAVEPPLLILPLQQQLPRPLLLLLQLPGQH